MFSVGFHKNKNSVWHEARTQECERIHWSVSFLPNQVPGSSPCVSRTWCTDRQTAGTQNVFVQWVAELLGAVQIKHIFLSFALFMVRAQWDVKGINLSRISNGSFVRMKIWRSQRMKKSWRQGFGWRGSAGAELSGTSCAGNKGMSSTQARCHLSVQDNESLGYQSKGKKWPENLAQWTMLSFPCSILSYLRSYFSFYFFYPAHTECLLYSKKSREVKV